MNREQILHDALTEILRQLEDHPCKNEAIVEDVMNGNYNLCQDIGGDEATISEWTAIARKALQL